MRPMMNPEPYPIEPTLLAIFKLFIAARLIYQIVIIALRLLVLSHPLLITSLAFLVWFALIFAYLSSDGLRQRLGRYYLPGVLIVSTLGLLLDRPLYEYAATLINDASPIGEAAAALVNSLPSNAITVLTLDVGWNPMLFVPLVLVAWQYGFRQVIYFIVMMIGVRIVAYPLLLGSLAPDVRDLGLALVGRVLAFITVGYVVARLSRTLRHERDALRLANIQLANHVAMQDQLATSRERNRLARELHDTMAHSLSANAVQLEAAQALWDSNPTKVQKLVQQSLETTRSGLTETRRSLEALRASPLEDMGLVLAIQDAADSAAKRAGFELDFQFPAHLDTVSLAAEQTLYRCAQETLENIVKHASAHHVRVNLAATDHQLVLTIADDGRGFDLAAVNSDKQLGLLGMRERVELMGGSVDTCSHPGQGTTTQIRLGRTE